MKILWAALILGLASSSMPLFAADDECGGSAQLIRDNRLAEAEAAAARSAKGSNARFCSQLAGDAALLQGKEDFYRYYARAYLEELDTSFYLTKGDSPIFKVLSVATIALGMAADYGSAQLGNVTNNTTTAFETASRMNRTLDSTIGLPEYRKMIKTTIKDLRKISRGAAGAYPVVYPTHRNIPGISMARIHAGVNVCNAIRKSASIFVTTGECYFGSGVTDGAFVTLNAALTEREIANVFSAYPEGEWAFVDIGLSQKMADEWSESEPWTGLNYTYSDANQHAVTWYSDDFSKIVPYIKLCRLPELADCETELRQGALVWVKPAQSRSWYLAGQGLSTGKFQSTSWGKAL